MVQYRIERPSRQRGRRIGGASLVVLALLLLFGARSIAYYVIEYQWWKELGQVTTWLSMMLYSWVPTAIATLLAFAALWMTHARALKFAGAKLSEHPWYARVSALALLLLAYLSSAASLDTWTVVRYAGSRGLPAVASAWRDAVFGRPLSFYLFDLPFYSDLRSYLLTLIILSILIYWIAARAWQLRHRLPDLRNMQEIDPSLFRLEGGLESKFLRGAMVVFLLALAFRFFLARYQMVYNDHGFMVGIDYVDQNIRLPLQWLVIAACIVAAALVWVGRWVLAASMALALVISAVVPPIAGALFVKPNEISLERPFIQTHIRATRSAFGLDERVTETEYKARPDAQIATAQHKNTLENVRLWDWRAFHDTITQIQALRPYYVFPDSDVDRYTIDGQYRQVLASPRELDIRQLPDAQARWINPAFIYTHGYGLVVAKVSEITSDGLPVLLVQNAPPEINTRSLKLTRPEIYYGEQVHEPVFVRTAQAEFNYPAGADNVQSRYEGQGGFPISSLGLRIAAAIRQGDRNILLTNLLTPESRMMIRRRVLERLRVLAGFIEWDADPYLVITDAGKLVWTVDGYTVSDSHPYSQAMNVPEIGRVNYIRNSVKATVDAYDGFTTLYIFAPSDPIILAYQKLFPNLFRPAAEMPADLRTHVRYPEALFRIQAEIYRTYHMLDAQAFYNKEDVWNLARYVTGAGSEPRPMNPTYVVASLPNQDKPEFLLMMPFTPRNKDNLVGLMLARCDGESLGEIVVMQLSKQELIFGPMQIAARINQDQIIAKDLSLWNQQGSRVLRGQMLVLPIGDTFVYVDPIYIQATEARMPQLKKVVVAVGNRMIYSDNYDQAIAQLGAGTPPPATQVAAIPSPPAASPPAVVPSDRKLESVRNHLRRYRDLMGRGQWAEAGKELESIESELK